MPRRMVEKKLILIFLYIRSKLKKKEEIKFITVLMWERTHVVDLRDAFAYCHTAFVIVSPSVTYTFIIAIKGTDKQIGI